MAIANLLMDRENYELALQYYLTALELDNTLEYIDLFIAVAFYKTNQPMESGLYLKKAIALNNDAVGLFLEVCPDARISEILK